MAVAVSGSWVDDTAANDHTEAETVGDTSWRTCQSIGRHRSASHSSPIGSVRSVPGAIVTVPLSAPKARENEPPGSSAGVALPFVGRDSPSDGALWNTNFWLDISAFSDLYPGFELQELQSPSDTLALRSTASRSAARSTPNVFSIMSRLMVLRMPVTTDGDGRPASRHSAIL